MYRRTCLYFTTNAGSAGYFLLFPGYPENIRGVAPTDDLCDLPQIASLLGYQDTSSFNAMFRRNLNMTPNAFRETNTDG